MIICVDFDGTCVTHEYPKVGRDIGAVPVLKRLVECGHKLVLFTMRSGEGLDDAVEWFKDNGIDLYGVNENPTQKQWTKSPKAFGNLYIDDAALGCPMWAKPDKSERPYVDWVEVSDRLHKMGLFNADHHTV